MKIHPFADLFPMMPDDEIQSLADNIAENGQNVPIVLFQGQILDGRNRFRACKLAGVEPITEEFEGTEEEAFRLAVNLNSERRDLTAGQRAMAAARALPQFEEARAKAKSEKAKAQNEARKTGTTDHAKIGTNGTARSDAAKAFKVSGGYVDQAANLLTEAPDLASQVNLCALTMSEAFNKLKERRKELEQKAKDAKELKQYKDEMESGKMTAEEALEKLRQAERERQQEIFVEADARNGWLKKLGEFIRWIEMSVATRDDEHLEWYGIPDSPGFFDQGFTAESVLNAAMQLERVSTFSLGKKHERNAKANAKGIPKASR